jgi:uncharacterized protein
MGREAKTKNQIIIIHGGDTYDSYEEYIAFLKSYEFDFEGSKIKKWNQTLAEKLGDDFDVISPRMPNSLNAKYSEWKIMFEKLLPFLNDDIVLLGHSLGGIFLAKYLSENDFHRKIMAIFLISAPYDDSDSEYSLADFILPEDLNKLQKQGGKIFIYHSKDDPVVPFVDFEKYKKAIPGAKTTIFIDRGHFDQAEFPELVNDIKNLWQ